MAKLVWDQTGARLFETGVDHAVLYVRNNVGNYPLGVPWNGLTAVTESPSGAESNPQYADNIKYLNLVSAEEFGATIEAFTFPDEFLECDGSAVPTDGLVLGQQGRKTFGLSYRTKIGNDVDGQDAGYKIHLVYGALAAPSEKAYTTINDSPEAITFSWEVTTSPINVTGYKPLASLTIDSTKVAPEKLAELEDLLYGTVSDPAQLPLPDAIIALFGTPVEVTATAPTFDTGTDEITIPVTAGVDYRIGGTIVPAGIVAITEPTTVTATAKPGYTLTGTASWPFTP